MKIVIIGYMLTFGGIERQIISLANEMSRRGHEVHFVSLVKNNICFPIDKSVDYTFLPEKGEGKIAIVNRYLSLKRYIKGIRPEVTLTFGFQPAYFCAFMRKEYTGKLVYSERGDPNSYIYNRVLRMIRRLILPRIDFFVFQFEGVKNLFKKSVRERSAVIHNPSFIEYSDAYSKCEHEKTIINVGRLSLQKNQKLLLSAFAKVHKAYPDYKLKIFGDGELESQLLADIKDYGLEGNAFLMGASDKVYDEMLDAEMFVLSSDFEGLPNVLIEAMSLAVPCISTDCRPGGAKEIIHNGVDGIIVPYRDVAGLEQAIIFFIENREEAVLMGQKAAKSIQRFSPDKIYDCWEKVLVNLLT